MCFSATASFTASGVLAIAGIVSIVKTVQRKHLSFLPIALIPLIFAIQQFMEGLVWLYWLMPFVWIYLFIAYAFWPIWVPLSLAIFDTKRRILFLCFLVFGIIVSLSAYGDLLWHANLVEPKVVSHSICYVALCIAPSIYEILLYGAATMLPPLLSSSNKLKVFGALVLIAAIISYLFYFYAFASVWCFFAAIISLWIVFLSFT